mgnify:CR=1 FL=1
MKELDGVTGKFEENNGSRPLSNPWYTAKIGGTQRQSGRLILWIVSQCQRVPQGIQFAYVETKGVGWPVMLTETNAYVYTCA